jgi:hypothetical protein
VSDGFFDRKVQISVGAVGKLHGVLAWNGERQVWSR